MHESRDVHKAWMLTYVSVQRALIFQKESLFFAFKCLEFDCMSFWQQYEDEDENVARVEYREEYLHIVHVSKME